MADKALSHIIIWKQVPTSPRYEVSNYGQVRKHVNKTHPERRAIAPMKLFTDKDGYLYLKMTGKKWLIHRLVYAVFCGELVDGLVICHLDGTRTNNIPENLLQTTQKENIYHKRKHGTWQCGEKHGNSKYSDITVKKVKIAIKKALKYSTGNLRKGEAKKISLKLRVPYKLVLSLSRKRESWKHV